MADTLTVTDAPENTGELSAEEQDSLQVGEQLAKEEGELLAGKYKNAEDLEKAYIELQKKLGGEETKEEPKAETEETTESDTSQYLEDGSVNYETVSEIYGDEVSSIFKNKGIDPFEINNYFHDNNGTISDDMYKQLEGAGFSKQLVDAYLNGRSVESGYTTDGEVEVAQKDITRIQDSVGGEAEYNKVIQWAGQNLPESEISSFDKVVSTGDPNVIQLAVDGLKAKYDNSNGYEGRMLTGKNTTSSEVYRSQAQLVAAMSDPRYDNDPAYRADVIEKLNRSDLQF